MAEMLKFKKGLYASLPNTYTAGTVYVTTDEQAMYVDISNEKRIRLGQIISYNTIEDFQSFLNSTKPPYSTEAFYYVADKNALLKWVATNGDTTIAGEKSNGTWKQINSTKEVADAISKVDGEVKALKGTVGNATSGLVKDVNDLKTTVGNSESGLVKDVAGHTTDIENLKKAVGMGDNGEIEGIGATVAQLSEDLDALELEVHGTNGEGGMKATLAGHTGKITALEQASAQHVTKTEAEAFAKTADIQATLNKVDTENGVTAAITAAVAGEKSRAEGAEQALTEELARVKNTANSAVSNSTFEQFKTDNTNAINDAKNAAVSSATGAANEYTYDAIDAEVLRANAAYAPIDTVQTVAGHTGTLATLTSTDPTTVGSVAEAKKAADDAKALAGQKTTMEEVEAKNYATKAEAQGYADAKDASIQAAANAAAAAKGDAKKAQEAADAAQGDATKALNAIGDDNSGLTQAVNANTAAIAILNGTDSVNGSVANAKKAGTDAAAQANTNKQDIASLKGTVNKLNGDVNTEGSVKKQIKDATDALETSLTNKITDEINAANAMDYKEGIASQTALNAITAPKAGDTYVVTAKFGEYYPGDLLIATGEENDEGKITTGLTWTHVKTGYDATLEQSISGNDNKITLSSVSGGNKGEITFAATAGSATTVSVANNTVTVGIEWDNF